MNECLSCGIIPALRMRIAYFTDTFIPQVNGVATSLANLSYELGRRDHQVVIFTPKCNINRPGFHAKNVEVVELPSIPTMLYTEFHLSLFAFPSIVTKLSKFKPDIIHSHTPLTIGLSALTVAKLLKIPLVGTYHVYYTNDDYLEWFNFLQNKLVLKTAGKVTMSFIKVYYDACDLRLAPSKQLIFDLQKVGYKTKVHHLPNPIRRDMFSRPKAVVLKRLEKKLLVTHPCFIYFGRVSAEKKVDLLIQSFHQVTNKLPQATLIIIGDGPAMKKCKQLVTKLHIAQKVHFTGFMSYDELIIGGYLYIGDVFVSQSPMETQPMSVLESMAAGLPIIGVKKAGMVELVDDNGILVDENNPFLFAQAMADLVMDKKLMHEMAEHSRRKAEQFSVDRVVNKLLPLYKKTISSFN